MKKDEAKQRIRNLFPQWKSANPQVGAAAPLVFYAFIQNEHPYLLEFRDSGDRYQTVACWVSSL